MQPTNARLQAAKADVPPSNRPFDYRMNPKFEMNFSLSDARRVWHAFFRSGTHCESYEWTGWANTVMVAVTEPPPPWLCDLSNASSQEAAIAAVALNLGLETPSELDEHALLIGFVLERRFNCELSDAETWARLNHCVDIAELLDGRRWEPLLGKAGRMTSTQAALDYLGPLAAFSANQASLHSIRAETNAS